MAWSTTFRSDIAALVFLATAIANIADNAASSPISNIYISLHESDPVAGNQTTGEGNYTDYARQPVARSGSGWDNTSGVVDNDAEIAFPACTGGSDTISHVGTGTAVSGTGKLLIPGAASANLSVSTGITPRIAAGALVITVA
jgi:hypothetical protein